MNQHDVNYIKLKECKLKEVLRKEKTVSEVSLELNVSRQSIHKWLIRYERFGIDGLLNQKKAHHPVPHNKTSKEKEDIVISMSKKHWQDGVETLHDRIQYEYNEDIHPVTIYRILKRNNIRYTDTYTQTQRRWKKKLYAHQQAGKELQVDTTYPYGYKQGKVIYTSIDDATRWVFMYSYSKATAENTLDFLQKLIERSPFQIQKIRTDQGKEFIAKVVKSFLIDNKINQRSNTPYSPEENGKIERFHRTLNEKALPLGFFPNDSLDTMQYKLTLFTHYYNFRKKHRGLGMDGMTPYEKLQYLRRV